MMFNIMPIKSNFKLIAEDMLCNQTSLTNRQRLAIWYWKRKQLRNKPTAQDNRR